MPRFLAVTILMLAMLTAAACTAEGDMNTPTAGGIEKEPPATRDTRPAYRWGMDPANHRAEINDLGPAEQAREIGEALSLGFSVENVRIARGFQLRLPKSVEGHGQSNSNVVQPIVFASGIYGYVAPGSGDATNHSVAAHVIKSGASLVPMRVSGTVVRHPRVGPAILYLAGSGSTLHVIWKQAGIADPQLREIRTVGAVRSNRR